MTEGRTNVGMAKNIRRWDSVAEIRIKLEGQLLTIQNQEIIASGNVNYDTCIFAFDKAWEGFVKTAAFYQDKTKVQYAVLGSDGTCTIPAAAMAKEGNMYFGVFGVNGTKVITSTVERVYIRQGAISGDTVSAEPGDDIFLAIVVQYQQVMEQMQAYDIKMDEFIGIMNGLNAYDVADVMKRLTAAEERLQGMDAVVESTVKEEITAVSGGLRFAQDGNGEWGYVVPGSGDVIPFSAQGYVKPGWDGEIENTIWVQMPSGTYSNFIKAICKNGYPVAITADGTVVYSFDGESWEKSKPGYKDCTFTDIDWDGERFLITGSYVNEESNTVGLLLATEDFKEYTKIDIPNSENTYAAYYAVYPVNGKYTVVALRKGTGNNKDSVRIYIGDFSGGEWNERVFGDNILSAIYSVRVIKNSTGILVYFNGRISDPVSYYREYIYGLNEVGDSRKLIENVSNNEYSLFECKDTVYYFSYRESGNYQITKVLDPTGTEVVSSGQNFAFVGGVYFNKQEVFINARSMLVVKTGEKMGDKTVDDLIEISPETAMSCITKAFGRIYIFGNRGLILKSS